MPPPVFPDCSLLGHFCSSVYNTYAIVIGASRTYATAARRLHGRSDANRKTTKIIICHTPYSSPPLPEDCMHVRSLYVKDKPCWTYSESVTTALAIRLFVGSEDSYVNPISDFEIVRHSFLRTQCCSIHNISLRKGKDSCFHRMTYTISSA